MKTSRPPLQLPTAFCDSGESHSRGFTLLEAMVVLALIAVLASLSVAGLQGLRRRVDLRGFISDFTAAVSNAQSRSLANGGNTWVIVYQTSPGATGVGQGGYYLYDDPDGDFNLASFTVNTATGVPTFTPKAPDRILDQVLLMGVAYRGRVAVSLGTGPTLSLNAPFSGVASSCNFCSTDASGQVRGAMVFQGDGSVRFVQGDGTPAGGVTTTGILTLSSPTSQTGTERGALAVSALTGFMRVTRP